jgi:hypothetical protein
MAALIAACWYGMLIMHESGHVLAARITGGAVQRVVLLPWTFSRTDVDPNPHAAVVAWAGAIFGGLCPYILSGVSRLVARQWTKPTAFFAGFCLIANGAYLATVLVLPVGDTEDLLRLGAPAWIMATVVIPMFGAGLWLWHTLGKRGSHEIHSDPSSAPRGRDGIDRIGPG